MSNKLLLFIYLNQVCSRPVLVWQKQSDFYSEEVHLEFLFKNIFLLAACYAHRPKPVGWKALFSEK